ncbi:hypothetical protein [Actinomadura opuntiae]|uniref:hypothetical protein n=1 Tax=Actinomadura sp. OS1-43 TaxID=604315 RepID=UPI00255AE899|nr:hypothetical protein [Actinomadura sp. OS1-43]MDL4817867.1 hypothetical protein [Actinomadura sp. OS1-43]
MRVSGADGREIAEVRRRHLAALAYELEARGLSCRLAGPAESVLSVHGPRPDRHMMVVATPVGTGWSYLWAGGGMADTATDAAVLICIALGVRP